MNVGLAAYAVVLLACIGAVAGQESPFMEETRNCARTALGPLDYLACVEVYEVEQKQENGINPWEKSLDVATSLAMMYMDSHLPLKAMEHAKDVVTTVLRDLDIDPKAYGSEVAVADAVSAKVSARQSSGYSFSFEGKFLFMYFVWHKYMHNHEAAVELLNHLVKNFGEDRFGFWQHDYYRYLGNLTADIVPAANAKFKGTPFFYRMSESTIRTLDLFPRRHLSARAKSATDDRKFAGALCEGVHLPSTDYVKGVDLVEALMRCLARSEDSVLDTIRREGEEKVLSGYLTYTKHHPLHTLSGLGAVYPLRLAADYLELDKDWTNFAGEDHFRRRPVFTAAAYGQEGPLRFFLSEGESIKQQDKGKVSPLSLACMAHGFRSTATKLAKRRNACDKHVAPYSKQETDEVDETGDDGGWNPKQGAKMKNFIPQCGVDQRDAQGLTHFDLIIVYLYVNRPVVLRGGFYPDGADPQWRKKNFVKKFGRMRVRRERAPHSEDYGIPIVDITRLEDFVKKAPPAEFATVDPHMPKTALWKLASWLPHNLEHTATEAPFITAGEDQYPHIMVFTPGAETLHVQEHRHTVHQLVFGTVDYTLLPPKDAVTTRGGLDSLPQDEAQRAISCTMVTGDVLVLPEFWSASFKARTNGIMVRRDLEWRNMKKS